MSIRPVGSLHFDEEGWITIEGFDVENYDETRAPLPFGYDCRSRSQAALVLAMRLIAEQLGKDIEYDHTGKQTAKIATD